MADNRLGPAVATLVAASMRGGTSQCLHSFGFQSPQHQDRNNLVEIEGSCSACSNTNDYGPPFERGEEAEAGRNKEGGEVLAGGCSKSGGSGSSSSSGGGAGPEDVGKVVAPEHNRRLRPQQKTPGVELTSLYGGSESGGSGGRREEERRSSSGGLSSTTSATSTAAAAFEQELGRPQTAGTASG